jgi:hypothetical protein
MTHIWGKMCDFIHYKCTMYLAIFVAYSTQNCNLTRSNGTYYVMGLLHVHFSWPWCEPLFLLASNLVVVVSYVNLEWYIQTCVDNFELLPFAKCPSSIIQIFTLSYKHLCIETFELHYELILYGLRFLCIFKHNLIYVD